MLCSSPAGSRLLSQQLMWEMLGVVACGVAALFDYRKLKKIPWLIFGATLALLVAVFLPKIGLASHGAHRWLNLQIGSFQPSELAKLTLIIVLAYYAERYGRQMPMFYKHAFLKGMFYPGLIIGAVLGLVFLEPDYGTTLLLAAVSCMMLIIAGTRLRLVIPIALIGLTAIGYSIKHNQNRSSRMEAFFRPELHLDGKAYQQDQ